MESFLAFMSSMLLFGGLRRLRTKQLPLDSIQEMDICLNPCQQVRMSCNFVCALSKSVFIDVTAVEIVASELAKTDMRTFIEGVRWDADDWHFAADAKESGPLTCQYIFVLDCLNFCFWPVEGLEYDYLARSLKEVLIRDLKSFDADVLANMTEKRLQHWFSKYQLPMLSERVMRLRELGAVLKDRYDGLACNVVFASGNSAVQLVRILIENIPGFRDTAMYDGHFIHLYKRAQILVGDVWAAYGRPVDGHKYYLTGIEQLTTFPDYRIPQLLRAFGILTYSKELSNLVDSKKELDFSSTDEVEIRASTVVAVDMLHAVLMAKGLSLTVVELDWLLWQKGELAKERIKPHHRTRTIFY